MNNQNRNAVVVTVLLGLTFSVPACLGATSVTSTIDGGGRRVSSASYTIDGSLGGLGGLASSAAATARAGFVGQLFEVSSLTLTGTPVQLNELGTSQLSGAARLDDATVLRLAGGDILWSTPSWPIQGISTGGMAAAAAVYANAPATVNGRFRGVAGTGSLLVLESVADNYPGYTGDGLPDNWQVQYFGAPPNANAGAGADPDGDGLTNLQEYQAGTNPTNAASPAVREYLAATKLRYYEQSGDVVPTLASPGYGFYALVRSAVSTAVSGVTDRVPSGSVKTLAPNAASNEFSFSQFFTTQSGLDGGYSNGVYQLTISTRPSGSLSPSLTLTGDLYPNVPRVLNETAAQSIDPAAAFTVHWTNFVGGTAKDYVSLEIEDGQQKLVFQTPDYIQAGRLSGTATAVVIPAGTLAAGGSYVGRLLYLKVTVTNSTSIAGAMGLTGYGAQTTFALASSGGWLWAGSSDLGGGWRWLDWFGYFNTTSDPWINHNEHGWLYPFGTETSSIVFWDAAMSGGVFWWTSATTYPYVYRFSDGSWLWYQKGSVNPRWFNNITAGAWESW